ncbi:RES domain-containing protein [Cohnella sp.]|uniref:RES domain-containing protein n=1 Tax=Cohnella sp. TaxID=1883426 RepID=UPI00356589DB
MSECNVFCINCFNEIKSVISKLNIKANINRRPRTVKVLDCTIYKCLQCNSKIESLDQYFLEEYFEEEISPLFEKVGSQLSKKIYGCFKCVGEQLDYNVYRWNKDEDDSSNYIENNAGQTIENFLWDGDIADQFHEPILEYLQCQSCHYGIELTHHSHNPDGGIFELHDQVYDEHETNSVYGLDDFDLLEFSEFAQKYDINLSLLELHEFKDHLLKYPLLAYMHKTGQKVYALLKKHYEEENYIKLKSSSQLYRGRTRKKEKEQPFTNDEMWNPPEGLPQHGRYNTVGVSVLYLSNRKDAIPYEINPFNNEIIDIAQFKTRKKMKLFNISSFDPGFQGFFNEINEESKPLKRAYLLTNFIGNCCTEIGYHGLVYQGVNKRKYTNYALFNFEKGTELQVVEVSSHEVEISYNLRTGKDHADKGRPGDRESPFLGF